MRRLFSFLSGRGQEREARTISLAEFTSDTDVEALGFDETQLLTRQLMALSRRRRCSVNHLGVLNPFEEKRVDWEIARWFRNSGYTKDELVGVFQADLAAIMIKSSEVSEALQQRILLTRYFSPIGELEDVYSYGDINPFIFETCERRLNFRETLFDSLNFQERVETVMSFDPEVRGHRHQIRYFRALHTIYSLAHLLDNNVRGGETQGLVEHVLNDELAMARGWITTVDYSERFGIEPVQLEPDESLLYNQDKVYESAMLFKGYERVSRQMFSSF